MEEVIIDAGVLSGNTHGRKDGEIARTPGPRVNSV